MLESTRIINGISSDFSGLYISWARPLGSYFNHFIIFADTHDLFSTSISTKKSPNVLFPKTKANIFICNDHKHHIAVLVWLFVFFSFINDFLLIRLT